MDIALQRRSAATLRPVPRSSFGKRQVAHACASGATCPTWSLSGAIYLLVKVDDFEFRLVVGLWALHVFVGAPQESVDHLIRILVDTRDCSLRVDAEGCGTRSTRDVKAGDRSVSGSHEPMGHASPVVVEPRNCPLRVVGDGVSTLVKARTSTWRVKGGDRAVSGSHESVWPAKAEFMVEPRDLTLRVDARDFGVKRLARRVRDAKAGDRAIWGSQEPVASETGGVTRDRAARVDARGEGTLPGKRTGEWGVEGGDRAVWGSQESTRELPKVVTRDRSRRVDATGARGEGTMGARGVKTSDRAIWISQESVVQVTRRRKRKRGDIVTADRAIRVDAQGGGTLPKARTGTCSVEGGDRAVWGPQESVGYVIPVDVGTRDRALGVNACGEGTLVTARTGAYS